LRGYILQGDYRFTVTGLTDDELLGQATAAVLTMARGLDVSAGAEPWAASSGRRAVIVRANS
jgi:hypothetical protein